MSDVQEIAKRGAVDNQPQGYSSLATVDNKLRMHG